MSKVRVYVDCQFFQTPAWDRGMGRYSLSLLSALKGQAKSLELVLLFSQSLPVEADVMEVLSSTCPEAVTVELPLVSTEKSSYKAAAIANKRVLNEYIDSLPVEDYAKQVFLIPCLFQEPTCSVFPDNVERCLIYYDAIPLLYYQRYRSAINYENYLARYQAVYQADQIFTISQTVADDLAVYLGMNIGNGRVINIDGACIEGMLDVSTRPLKVAPSGVEYILLPSSNDIRKNNLAAVRSFEQLRSITNTDYKMVITSSFKPEQQLQLQRLSNNLIFVGNVSNAELSWLYEHAAVVLFTSEYEGLGLPVLEAVSFNKPVACSSIPVFREISEQAFYLFDPLDVEDITLKLLQALNGDGWEKKQKLYGAINDHYTWERSAKIFYKSLNQVPTSRGNQTRPVEVKPRIAVLCPTPEGYSAIGKVVQELHGVMAEYCEIDYYFEDKKEQPVSIRPNCLSSLASCYKVEEFNARTYADYDAVIYHVGNSEYHFSTIQRALYLPGIVILHDTFLTEAYGEMVRLGYIPIERMHAEEQLQIMLSSDKSNFIGSLVHNQVDVLVHSQYAQHAVTALAVGQHAHRAELPVSLPIQNVQLQDRDLVHIGIAGILTGRKGIDIIKEIAVHESIAKDVVLHVFGFSTTEPNAIKELKNLKNVKLSTNLTDLEYQMQLANLDILVNYRTSYRGETSLTVLEAMRYGCVVVVNGSLGWFSELPDDAVVKVTDQSEVISCLQLLVRSRAERMAIAARAKTYVGQKHDPHAYAKHLMKLVLKPTHNFAQQRVQILKTTRSSKEVLRAYKKLRLSINEENE